MIRLLHVCDREPDFQTSRAIEQLTAGLSKEFSSRTLTIGRAGELGNIARAALRLRREVQSCDIIHAWGISPLSAIAFGRFERIFFTPTEFPSRRQIAWLRAIMSYRNVNVICPTFTMQKAFLARGIAPDRCHLVRPGVDFARIKPRRDPQLRAALGLEDSHQVLLAIGESTRDADHRQAVWTGTILNVLDRNTRLILWGRGPLANAAADFGAKLAQPQLVILAEQKLRRKIEFEEIFAAADMLLISSAGPVSTLPIAIAMAAALPIIATVTPTVAELLEDRHTALMTQPAIPRLLAQRITQMRDDSQLQWTLADTARREAYELFPLTKFLEEMRTVYHQIWQNQPDNLSAGAR